MKRVVKTILGGAALALGMLASQRALASDAVVTILITDNSGARAFGSGFVSSDSGEVITCYHVVEGAKQISVFYRKGAYDAQVLEIAPDRDTAKLRMNGVSLPTKFFPVRYDLPSGLSSRPLDVEGFAAGLGDQRLEAHATQDGFASTDQMRGLQNERLFAVGGVKILPLTLTVYKGMSGAPLLTREGQVIGIISGSLTQGGSIAWAIAIENTLSRFMTKVQTPMANFSWPSLALMLGNWGNLRSQSGIGQELVGKIEVASQAIEAARRTFNVECADDNVVVGGLSNLVQTFDRYPSLANMPVSVLDQSNGDGHALGASAVSQLNVVSPQMDTGSRDVDVALTTVRDALAKFQDLKQAASDFQGNLPRTPRNAEIISQMTQQSSLRDVELSAIFQSLEQSRQRAHQLIARPYGKDLVSDYQGRYATLLEAWKIYQQTYCASLPSAYKDYLDEAVDYRLLLNAEVLGLSGN